MKNILIIGGSSGIGAALVSQLQESCNITATYNNNPVTSQRDSVNYISFDATKDELDSSILPEVIDGFVYCPGGVNLLPFGRIKQDKLVQDFDTQVLGAVKTLQAVLPNLKRSESASVLFFSTVAVQTGFNFHSQVAICKGAIEGLTKSLAAEFAPKIRVNAIAPSLTQTSLTERLLNSPEKIEANASRHPLKKIGTPENIAHLSAFLLSDQSNWITGQIIHADGGIGSIKS